MIMQFFNVRKDRINLIWFGIAYNVWAMKIIIQNYLNFFQEEVQKKGIKRSIEHYVFEQDSKSGFYSRFLAGVYHPLIHLGYGIELNHPWLLRA